MEILQRKIKSVEIANKGKFEKFLVEVRIPKNGIMLIAKAKRKINKKLKKDNIVLASVFFNSKEIKLNFKVKDTKIKKIDKKIEKIRKAVKKIQKKYII